MPTLYLIEQQTILRKTSDRLRLCRMRTPGQRKSHVTEGEVLLEIPCADIDHVMAFGNIQFTTQALHELLEHGIEVALFSYSGRLVGQLTPPKTKNIFLRIEQFNKYQDMNFRLQQGKFFVKQKINSMLEILKKYKNHHPDSFTNEELRKIEHYKTQAQTATSLDSLLGFEGSASSLYFQLFGRMVRSPWKFTGRNRRPPKDPVNSVLSFGYVIVGAELQSLLDGIGFDPYLGFYHATSYGRPSLALDLVEEFRHSFIDHLAIQVFNQGIFNQDDFSRSPEGGVLMNTAGKKKFFQYYEKMAGQYSGAVKVESKGFRSKYQSRIQQMMKVVCGNKTMEAVIGKAGEDFDSE